VPEIHQIAGHLLHEALNLDGCSKQQRPELGSRIA
jgi:hypothetical protein